jgi:hypothetical protein
MLNLKKTWSVLKRFRALFSVMVVFLLLALLVISNYANNQTLVRNDLQNSLRSAEDRLRLASITVSELQATKRLENESQRLDLVKMETANIYYLKTVEEKVALK